MTESMMKMTLLDILKLNKSTISVLISEITVHETSTVVQNPSNVIFSGNIMRTLRVLLTFTSPYIVNCSVMSVILVVFLIHGYSITLNLFTTIQ